MVSLNMNKVAPITILNHRFRNGYYLLLCYALTVCMTGFATSPAQAQSKQTIRSTAHQATLLELYTSQGCYSCPPAEQWLNGLVNYKHLWRNVVPIALHVDYWDYLGWKDPYAEKKNQVRHYALKKQGLTKAIYTPQMITNGSDWYLWGKQSVDDFPLGKQVGVLELDITGNKVHVIFDSNDDKDSAGTKRRAHIALLGFGLSHTITAGENKDKQLEHEFVALAQTSGVNSGKGGNHFEWTFDLPSSKHAANRLAIIGWVENEDSHRAIQATGDWIKQ